MTDPEPNDDATKYRKVIVLLVQAESHAASAQYYANFYSLRMTLELIELSISNLQSAREVMSE